MDRRPALDRNGALGEIRTPDPRNRNPMLYPAELRAPWSSQPRTAPALSQGGRARHAEVFAFGREFFNTRWRSRGWLARRSVRLFGGLLCRGLLGGALHGSQIAVGGIVGGDLDPAGGGGGVDNGVLGNLPVAVFGGLVRGPGRHRQIFAAPLLGGVH